MTRETKIGLLVGLAFIIVIGILLSDHLTSSTEPPAATLTQAGSNMRQQVATPAGPAAPVATIVAPNNVTPTQQIATQRDLAQPTQASAVVQVGGPIAPPFPARPVETSTPVEPPITQVKPVVADNTNTQQTSGNTPPVAMNSAEPGSELVDLNGKPVAGFSGSAINGPVTNTAKVASTDGMKDYTIAAGDTLSKIAGRFMGGNTKANRDLIVKANPSLAANPDKLVVGKTYKIPTKTATAAAAPVVAQPVIAQAPTNNPEPIVVAKTESASTDSSTVYTVKPGDSLWKIAATQLGNGGAGVAAIKELNKEVLNGGDVVMVDMKLKMPGKPIASAN